MFAKFFRFGPIIGTLPVTLTNGTTADATQVMSDLNWIVNQVNANAADATLVALLAANNNFTAVQSGIAATAAAHFPIASQVQNSTFLTLTSTLGTNTITARNLAFPLGAYVSGQVFTFVPSQTNSGAISLNIDSLGSGTVQLNGAAVASGQIRQDVPVAVRVMTTAPIFEIIGNSAFAPLNSPALTGTPAAPTAAAGTSTTQIATTAFVDGVYRSVQVFTGTGTWTKPTGLKRVKVTVVAGGGGGRGVAQGASAAGAGGGAGGTAIETIAAASLGATETVTVGAAGAAGADSGADGGNGGTSSFGAHCSASGGAGGSTAGGAPGGSGTGGDINLTGGGGGQPITAENGAGGMGGTSFMGGGAPGSRGSQSGATGGNYGGGGAGACDNNTAGRAGGSGAAGIVIVEEFF